MTHVERFRAVMNFQPVDRLPRWEWAMWWDETIRRWRREGLPPRLQFHQVFDIASYFGLDPYQQFWFSTPIPPSKPRSTMSKALSPASTTICASGRTCFHAMMAPLKG
jgi:hypothetical protein